MLRKSVCSFLLILLIMELQIPLIKARYLDFEAEDLFDEPLEKRFIFGSRSGGGGGGTLKNMAISAAASAILSKLMGGSAGSGAKAGALTSGVMSGIRKLIGKKK
ncbi:hypothetical protein SNEBB_011032 [Seison nebaliae]|nr:hypothetical protein SNEBB_011032 [Seison nebaliae]